MTNNNQQWTELGKNIQDIVDQAVRTRDYQQLNASIRNVVDQAMDLGSEVLRNVVGGNTQQTTGESAGQKNLPALYGSVGGKKVKGILKAAGGGVLSLGAFALVLVDAAFGALGMGAVLGVAGLAGGVWMILSGTNAAGRVDRFRTYKKLLGQKTYCAMEKLARGVGKSEKFVRNELRQMIREGYFLEGHIDREGKNLITSDETYRYFEQSRLQLEERKRQEEAQKKKEAGTIRDPKVQEVLDRGNAFIDQIRKCNDDIPGEEISAKIDRMEMIVRRIFQRAQTNPQIIPDLKKLMDYYLPMTVKLLGAYADMDAQPVQGENIQASKREIEGTLDTLNAAFEKLLDSVFADTAMDVSSDISVLNTLLAQEGLTGDDISARKNKQTL